MRGYVLLFFVDCVVFDNSFVLLKDESVCVQDRVVVFGSVYQHRSLTLISVKGG